jgi:hypothetical protein
MLKLKKKVAKGKNEDKVVPFWRVKALGGLDY